MNGPHYLMYYESSFARGVGRWRFRFQRDDGQETFEAEDIEPGLGGERLALLTVVRALESLDQPSRVTMINSDPYVRRGIRYGIPQWRETGWRWECFGQMVPVKDADLWQRLERALEFHEVDCRRWRIDPAHSDLAPARAARNASVATSQSEGAPHWETDGVVSRVRRKAAKAVDRVKETLGSVPNMGALTRAVG